jgi:hypothetical protein
VLVRAALPEPVVSDLPAVALWKPVGGAVYRKVATLNEYVELAFEPRHLDGGPWSLTVAPTVHVAKLAPPNLVTVDWRGVRFTGDISSLAEVVSDDGRTYVTASGVDCFERFDWGICYPDPTKSAETQTAATSRSTGAAETVLLSLIAANLRDRSNMGLVVPASLGRGSTVTVISRWQHVRTPIVNKGAIGGVGVRLGLVDVTGTTANLTVQPYAPRDRTKRVRLAQAIGTLASWEQVSTAPSATRAIVGGSSTAGVRAFSTVTTAASIAAATAWGGHREMFVDGPTSTIVADLIEAGQEQLVSGATTTNLNVVAAESPGLQAFRDYQAGDKATAQLDSGLTLADVITAISVTVDSEGPKVQPRFGDPDAADPDLAVINVINDLRRQIAALQATRDLT